MVGMIIEQVALKTGQKVAASIATKVATAVTAGVIGQMVCKSVEKKATPIDQFSEEEREGELMKRQIRDGCIGGVFAAVGGLIYTAANNAIQTSDIC